MLTQLLTQLLTPATQSRLSEWCGSPPDPTDPKTYARVAGEIVGDGPTVDRTRLALLLVAFDLQIAPQAIADICAALGEPPLAEAAKPELDALRPDAHSFVDALLAELADGQVRS